MLAGKFFAAEELHQLGLIDAFEVRQISANRKEYEVKIKTPGAPDWVDLPDVGFGVSQTLPVVVALHAAEEGQAVYIEQPEIHLHPALQAELADVFIESALGDQKNTFLLETHSEHLILRLLRRIRETTEKELPEGAASFAEDKLSVLHVESGPDGVQVRRLRVDERGEFKDRWPKGFFAERMEELL